MNFEDTDYLDLWQGSVSDVVNLKVMKAAEHIWVVIYRFPESFMWLDT